MVLHILPHLKRMKNYNSAPLRNHPKSFLLRPVSVKKPPVSSFPLPTLYVFLQNRNIYINHPPQQIGAFFKKETKVEEPEKIQLNLESETTKAESPPSVPVLGHTKIFTIDDDKLESDEEFKIVSFPEVPSLLWHVGIKILE